MAVVVAVLLISVAVDPRPCSLMHKDVYKNNQRIIYGDAADLECDGIWYYLLTWVRKIPYRYHSVTVIFLGEFW